MNMSNDPKKRTLTDYFKTTPQKKRQKSSIPTHINNTTDNTNNTTISKFPINIGNNASIYLTKGIELLHSTKNERIYMWRENKTYKQVQISHRKEKYLKI
eukprot:509035_1